MREKAELGRAVFLLAVFAVAGVAGFFIGDEALALPPNEVETFYYSDATYTNQIGWKILMCDGTRYREGSTSVYTQYYSTPCYPYNE